MASVYVVKAVTGVVFVVDVSGQVRTAKVGDRLSRGDTVLAGAHGRIELVADEGQALNLGPDEQVKIDEQLFGSAKPEAAQAAVAVAPSNG